MSRKPDAGRETLLVGGGEMGALMRAYDWSQTPLGPLVTWPLSLRTSLGILLATGYPMYIAWGHEFIQFYNDAYRPILGSTKHPSALGQRSPECFAEIWDVIGPMFEQVMSEGKATSRVDQMLPLNRNGYPEECYFTFSYSAIPDEQGVTGGVLVTVIETTKRVLSERRLQTLRELAANTAEARTDEEVYALSTAVLARNKADLPFALLYQLNSDGKQALLASQAGLQPEQLQPLQVIDLGPEAPTNLESIRQAFCKGQATLIQELTDKFGPLPGGLWAEPTHTALMLPIPTLSSDQAAGFLLMGISPRLAFDEEYRGFLELVTSQIATGVVNARAYEAERQRAEVLAEVDRTKTAFFSSVSHEFRTPLTLMLGPLEDALTNLSQAEEQGTKEPTNTEIALPNRSVSLGSASFIKEQLQMVYRNAQRLLKLVNTLLDFSRLEAGRVQASYAPVDLAKLTTELASGFSSATERANIRLVVDCPPLPEPVYVDPDMWEKIVLNLLSNAFKFTLAGEITIVLRWYPKDTNTQVCRDTRNAVEGPSYVELQVKDTGIGIPADELPHLFERFYQVKGVQGRSFEGSGIGLSLVQELAKLHGGTVQVTSVLGQGSCFTVSIPTGSVHLPQDRIGAMRTLTSTALGTLPYVEEAKRWLPGNSTEEADSQEPGVRQENDSNPQHSALSTQHSSLPHILLVDDNADMRDYLKRLLSQRYQVEVVADGVSALESIRQHPPDLVLSDVMMPKMDGFELLRSLRADVTTRQIPVILLSARAGEASRIEGLEIGADDYLIKPFSARELLVRVETNLKMARLRQEFTHCQQEQQLKVEAAEERYRAFVEQSSEAIWRIEFEQPLPLERSEDEQIEHAYQYSYLAECNQVMAQMYGFEAPGDMIGARLDDLLVRSDPRNTEYFRAFIRSGYRLIDAESSEVDRWGQPKIFLNNLIGVIKDGALVRAWGTQRDITERKRIEVEREQLLQREQVARAEAEAANRIKDEFLAVLSHELRSPLNPILGWAKLLQTSKLDQDKTVQALAAIERNAKLQSELIEDLLDVSRILQGKLVLNTCPVDLVAMIRSAMETVQLAAEAKSIQLQTKFKPDVGPVLGDPARLQQVVWNLLSNAVKFTPVGGRVEVLLEEIRGSGNQELEAETEKISLPGYAQIQVKDTGKGIRPDFLPYVFDYFRQADATTTRNFGGLGLGLAIVRHLVELHGGTVQVESPGEGLGATFTVQLPLMLLQPGIDRDNKAAEASLDLQGVRVLVVDDNIDALEFVAFLLEQAGAVVTTATSASKALALLAQLQPDVLLSDIGMPEVDGYGLVQQIRRLPPEQGGQIPAIALTAYAGDFNEKQALQAGFQRHLSKPIEPDLLIRAIATLLGRAA